MCVNIWFPGNGTVFFPRGCYVILSWKKWVLRWMRQEDYRLALLLVQFALLLILLAWEEVKSPSLLLSVYGATSCYVFPSVTGCEPSRREPSRRQPSRRQPSKCQPSRHQPSRCQPSRCQPSRCLLSRYQPSRCQLSIHELSRCQPSRCQSSKFQSSRYQPSMMSALQA